MTFEKSFFTEMLIVFVGLDVWDENKELGISNYL